MLLKIGKYFFGFKTDCVRCLLFKMSFHNQIELNKFGCSFTSHPNALMHIKPKPKQKLYCCTFDKTIRFKKLN